MGALVLPKHLRVLVVENDATQCADLVGTLSGWNYRVYVAEASDSAEDAHQSFMIDARQKALKCRCHLAIVDMRLRDDGDPSDTSGLELVKDLAPTVSIIRSAYGDRKTVREALRPSLVVPQRAYDFIGKEEGPDALHNVINEAVSTWWPRLVKENPIKWPHSIPDSGHLIQRFFPNNAEVPMEEIEDLLWTLYPDAGKLSVEALEGGDSSPSTGLRPRSIVVRVKQDNRMYPEIVKIARSDRSMDEYNKYHELVEGNFPHKYYATLKGIKTLWDVRGARYEHVGNWGRMTLFSTYYRSRRAEQICNVLRVFGTDWKDHYAKTRHLAAKDRTLYQIFKEVWGDNWHNRLSTSANPPQEGSSDFRDWLANTLGLVDPLGWLRKRVGISEADSEDDSPTSIPMAVLHGDLQGDNCFVDEEHGNLWLIDFERSGRAPIIADLVELEIDILTRLCCFSHQHRREFLELVARIMSPDANVFWCPTSLATGLPEAVKTLTVIQEIRTQAKRITGLGDNPADTRLYRWTSLLNIAFRLTLPTGVAGERDPRCNLSIAERCSILGGVICRSLEAIQGEWPPSEWGIPVPSRGRQEKSGLELEINLNDNTLVYKLNGDNRYVHKNSGQMKLRRPPEEILRGVFDKLSTLARKEPEKLTVEEAQQDEEMLADIGYNLYRDLFGKELQQEYTDCIRGGPSRNLLIVSSDPWIPWEIVKPQLEGIGDPHLCESFHLARWLSGNAPPLDLVLNTAVVVRPPDNLIAAQREQEYFSGVSTLEGPLRSSSSVATVKDVLSSFRTGEANLYHFACHGNFDGSDPNESKLKLADGFLSVNAVTAEKQAGLKKAKPLIFLNTCHSGNLGFGLTQLGGWAQRFIDSGASAFIGTLWAVNDQLAANFAIEFYNRLLGLAGHQPMPLARAFHNARLIIKQQAPANPTWLAYVLYGNPNAQVTQPEAR